jgi:sulfite reductase (NADPH) hemoprotein beta-component
MYQYDVIDKEFLADRSAEFRGQVARRLAGELTEDQFKPLRLMNGLYLQLHAYMLRIAIPYGSLNPTQARRLAEIARDYDKGYGHFTTRQNIQFNWIKLRDAPEILDKLAEVDLHAIQTSGNCIRNTTSDPYAGATAEEVDDPRVWSEVIRQWSTLHPEFSFLPRKFKIAITASAKDRTAAKVHDIGLLMRQGRDGALGFEVIVGGGQGRTPYVGPTIKQFLPTDRLLSYLEAVLRVYNRHGRRDNIYKARIKILVAALGAEEFANQVEEEWAKIDAARADLPARELARIRAAFAKTAVRDPAGRSEAFELAKATNSAFARFVRNNVKRAQAAGLCDRRGLAEGPGADAGRRLGRPVGRRRRSGRALQLQRPARDPRAEPRPAARQAGRPADRVRDPAGRGLATANIDLISDIIACPGLDYCALANARAIPIAQDIARQFADLDRAEEVGELKIKISGCINACGHHHVAHIGILGVDKKGEEFYQLSLGGSGAEDASIGKILGPALPADKVATAVDQLVGAYISVRADGERFLDTYRRVGLEPFKEAVYAQAD